MNDFSFDGIQIKAMAVAVPNDGEELMSYAGIYPEGEMEKFCKTTGIYHRYVGHRKRIIASDLCVTAANRIFEKFEGIKDEIDALIFMSQSFDYPAPATSGIIQMRLGLDNCGVVYDITYGCAAFPFGMQLAGSFIKGGCRNVLLLIGDSVTSADTSDKDAFLFGDAGTAIVVGHGGSDPINIRLETLGAKFKALMCPFGGQRHRYVDMVNVVGTEGAARLQRRYMDGSDVFTFSIKDAPAATKTFYETFNCSAADFDIFAIHQANKMIVENVAKRIKAPKERVHLSLDRFANTNGVSVPITICDYFENHPGCGTRKILSLAFGVGLSIGVCSCVIDSAVCLPIIKSDERFDDGLDYNEYLKKG